MLQGFRKFCQVLQPKFPLFSRMIVARDILELFIEEGDKLKTELNLFVKDYVLQQMVGHRCRTYVIRVL